MVLLVLISLFLSVNNIYAQEDLPYRDVTLQITHDTFYSNSAQSSFGRDKYLILGKYSTRDLYINYDMLPLTELNILPGDIIHAHLHIYQEENAKRNTLTTSISPITEYWHEQTFSPVPAIGEMISQQPIYGDPQTWQEIDISELVKYGLAHEYDYYGFHITTDADTTSILWSKDCEGGTRLPLCKAEEKPFITVRYWKNNPPSKPILITPVHEVVTEVFQQEFIWEPSIDLEGEDVQYMLEISFDREFEDILTYSPWISDTQYSSTLPSVSEYFWRVRARDEHLEHGENVSETNSINIAQSIQVELEVEDFKEQDLVEAQADTSDEQKIIYITEPDPKADSIGEVLGIQSIREEIEKLTQKVRGNKCTIKFLEGELNKQRCSISGFSLNDVVHKKIGSNYQITFTGELDEKVAIDVESTSCKKWEIFDPTTWFSNCSEASIEKTVLDINLDTVIYPKYEGKRLALVSHKVYKGKFEATYESVKDLSRQDIHLYRHSFASRSVNGNSFEILKKENLRTPIPKAIISNPTYSNGMGFPFKQWVGVTQWHGNTAYQRPHTGIDFGVTRKPVYSPEAGYIRAAQWDNYYGRCLSGGNTVRIEHDNGKHSVYMHLDNYKKLDGSPWRIGERIDKGELIGLTGNSGAYNCQTLGYHLHFEIRSSRPQSSHIDPTRQIGIDWEMVPTLGFSSYPGRLTGDNPHPGR